MYIPNEQLIAARIPPSDSDWDKIQRFALTFDGYTRWGFETCAAIANERRNSTLTELRTCLFFEQRPWRHVGEAPDEESMAYIQSVVEEIRRRVLAANNLLA